MPAPPPLALSDSQLTTIMQLSRPLLPDQRVTFVELLATRLNGHREIGDSALYQLCRDFSVDCSRHRWRPSPATATASASTGARFSSWAKTSP
jgi:hypothetical protein